MTGTRDWKGNDKSVFSLLGATNHSETERELNDYYATDPDALRELLKYENFNHNIWECAAGGGHLTDVLKEHGYNVRSSDIINRNREDVQILDFLNCEEHFDGDIITNPPYAYAQIFVNKALECVSYGSKIAMLLRLQFLEGVGRRVLFDTNPPKSIYVSTHRIACAKNGDFESLKKTGSAVAYAWFIWEKGYRGDPQIKWFN